MEWGRRIYGIRSRTPAGGRRYRVQKKTGDVQVVAPAVAKDSDSAYTKAEKYRLFRKRAGIGLVLCLCKTNHRLGRNFYMGLFGDSVYVMPTAAGFNSKRDMRVLLFPIGNLLSLLTKFFWDNSGHKKNEISDFLMSHRCTWDFVGTYKIQPAQTVKISELPSASDHQVLKAFETGRLMFFTNVLMFFRIRTFVKNIRTFVLCIKILTVDL